MLRDEQRGGHEHGHLLAVLNRLEGGAHGDLRLAVADVAGDEPVHRDRLLHVGLDLLDRVQLVGRLHVGEGVLQLALPRGIRRERETLRGLSLGVQAHQLTGDLLRGGLGLRLGLLPIGATHFVEGGRVAAGVLGDLVERIGGNPQLIWRGSTTGGGVLHHDVLALGLAVRADGSLGHLHETAHTVLFVHDEVAGFERERIHAGLAAGRHLAHVTRGGAAAAHDVRRGVDGEVSGFHEESRTDGSCCHIADGGLEFGRQIVHVESRNLSLLELITQAPPQARALNGEHEAPGLTSVGLDVRDRRVDLAEVALRLLGFDRGGEIRGQGVLRESAHAPPCLAAASGLLAGLRESREGGGVHVDRDLATGGGSRPSSGEEFLRSGNQGLGALIHTFGLHQDDASVPRQSGDHGDHGGHESRCEGFHTLGSHALGDLCEHIGCAGQDGHEAPSSLANVLCQQDLPARRGVDLGDGLHRALISHGEGADLIHLVAEQVHTQRMRLCGREDVDDPAAHCELTAALDHVHASVCRTDEILFELLDVHEVADPQAYRLQFAKPLRDRLQQGTHRHDQHRQFRELLGVGKAALYQQPLGNGVRARGEPLVRQRLPRWKDLHRLTRQICAQGALKFLGAAAGRRHGHVQGRRFPGGCRGPGSRAGSCGGPGSRAGGEQSHGRGNQPTRHRDVTLHTAVTVGLRQC